MNIGNTDTLDEILYTLNLKRKEWEIVNCICSETKKIEDTLVIEFKDMYLDTIQIDAINWKGVYQCKYCRTFWEETFINSRFLDIPTLTRVSNTYILSNWSYGSEAYIKTQFEYAKSIVIRELKVQNKVVDNIEKLTQDIIDITYGKGGDYHNYSDFASTLIENK